MSEFYAYEFALCHKSQRRVNIATETGASAHEYWLCEVQGNVMKSKTGYALILKYFKFPAGNTAK